MASGTLNSHPASDLRLSPVVPAEVTCGHKDHHLTNMDLALKLHYIRGVYFFNSEAVQGLTIYDLKKPMFPWLAFYYTASGRIGPKRDGLLSNVKIVVSGLLKLTLTRTIVEWLATLSNDHDHDHGNSCLVYDQVLGPELGFSPLVFIQFTWFKCGGMSVGLSWAHVLSDPFSASSFIRKWAQMMQGHVPSKSLHIPNPQESKCVNSTPRNPCSIKRVEPVGHCWLSANNCKMETHSFHVTAKQLDDILSAPSGPNQTPNKISHFHILSAIIWKSLSKIREDSGPRIVTICTSRSHVDGQEHEVPSNNMVFSIVQADFSVRKGDISELEVLMAEKQEEENSLIEEMVEGDNGEFDYVAYGANLTFVNMEGANVYGLELKRYKPVFANYFIKGVGDEGTVLVLPGPGNDGRTMTVILPENQLEEVKRELKKDWGIV